MTWFRCVGGNGGGQTKIPYVASNALQCVNLPIYCDDYPVIKAKLMTLTYSQQVIIGDGTWDVSGFIFYCDNTPNSLYLRYSNSGVLTIPNPKWCEPVDVEIDYTTGSIKYDGVLYTGSPKTQLHNQLSLFGRNSSNRCGNVFIFGLQIYTNDTLTMDLVPMEDSITGAGYLHDIVGGQDYYSVSSTPLIYGEFSV